MHRRTTFILLAVILFACACDFPYGPSYTIERQRIDVAYATESPARVHVAATYRLKITGDRELSAIRAVVPAGAQNFRAATKGVSLTAGAAEKEEASAIVPLNFAPPLAPKSKIQLTVEFDLPSQGASFYFPEREWFLELRPPEVSLAGGPRAKNVDLAVRVPQNYRVLSAGTARGAKHRGSAREFCFRIRDDDFNLFLLAGPYLEQKIQAAGTNVFLWTLQPLAPAEAQRAADRLAQTARLYEDAFGPRIRAHDPIWLVDFATSWRESQPGIELRYMSSFPRGALINLEQVGLDRFRATATGTAGLSLSASLDLALADLWFTHVATPDPDIGVLNLALSAYAQRLARDAQGTSSAPRTSPTDELARFDRMLGAARDTPILLLEPPVSGAQLRPARQKAILFLLALEENVGRQHLLAAVKRMIQSLRGSTYGWDELRAAVEAESGKDLAEFFRLWLTQPGIPAEFRALYAKP